MCPHCYALQPSNAFGPMLPEAFFADLIRKPSGDRCKFDMESSVAVTVGLPF